MKYDGLKISKESVEKIFPRRDIGDIDLSGYKSPIEVIIERINGHIEYETENAVYKAVQRIGVEVDKNELIKALRYDRNQYLTGYADGYRDGLNANKWISVDDMMPEDVYGKDRKKITVLVCTKSGKVSTASRQRKQVWDKTKLEFVELDTFEWSGRKRVTRWQHLPEPIKEV